MQASESRHRFWLLFLKLKLEKFLAGYKLNMLLSGVLMLILHIGSSINQAEDQHFGEQLGNIARACFIVFVVIA